jgi:hypothetical protein
LVYSLTAPLQPKKKERTIVYLTDRPNELFDERQQREQNSTYNNLTMMTSYPQRRATTSNKSTVTAPVWMSTLLLLVSNTACWAFTLPAAKLQRRVVGTSGSVVSANSKTKTTATTVLQAMEGYLPLDESTPRDVNTLMDQWATSAGIQRAEGSIQLATDDGEDWSFMSTTDLPANTPLVYVPAGVAISAAQIRNDYGSMLQPAIDYLARLGVSDDDQLAEFCLFTKLLTMYEEGEQCAWYPWLNSLPRLFYNALAMTGTFYTVHTYRVVQIDVPEVDRNAERELIALISF